MHQKNVRPSIIMDRKTTTVCFYRLMYQSLQGKYALILLIHYIHERHQCRFHLLSGTLMSIRPLTTAYMYTKWCIYTSWLPSWQVSTVVTIIHQNGQTLWRPFSCLHSHMQLPALPVSHNVNMEHDFRKNFCKLSTHDSTYLFTVIKTHS